MNFIVERNLNEKHKGCWKESRAPFKHSLNVKDCGGGNKVVVYKSEDQKAAVDSCCSNCGEGEI